MFFDVGDLRSLKSRRSVGGLPALKEKCRYLHDFATLDEARQAA